MGQIYLMADYVLAWLGARNSLVPTFRLMQENSSWKDPFEGFSSLRREIYEFVCKNEYWNRAWIVQEILLPEKIFLQLDAVAIEFDRIWRWFDFPLSTFGGPMQQFKVFKEQYLPSSNTQASEMEISAANSGRRGMPLMTLLYLFRERGCSVLRDRIYSLLGLSSEGAIITVDYESTMMETRKYHLAKHSFSATSGSIHGGCLLVRRSIRSLLQQYVHAVPLENRKYLSGSGESGFRGCYDNKEYSHNSLSALLERPLWNMPSEDTPNKLRGFSVKQVDSFRLRIRLAIWALPILKFPDDIHLCQSGRLEQYESSETQSESCLVSVRVEQGHWDLFKDT
ncbi:hypothetical protein GQ44DRAFT_732180 [Phaeosphaeriaceae sp. PMI808]|nr:hypothetical protein GQ44DRAFT_732180 [Phaeosphaeriaceae sp. PMI808]